MSYSRVVRPDPLERAEHQAAELPQPHGPEAQRPQARELRARDRGECVGPETRLLTQWGAGTAREAVPVPSAPAVASAEVAG